jgi:hypothetical protein
MFSFIKKMNFFKKMGEELSKQRKIDISVEKTIKSVKSGYEIVPSKEIKAWKAYLIVAFVAGFAAALIWGAYMSIYPVSKATGFVTLSTSAVVASHRSGEKFPVQIVLDTAGRNIVAVQAVYNYNKNALQVISADISGSGFNYEIKNTVDANQGQGFLALAKPTPGVSGAAVKVATVNLKALSDISEPTLRLKLDAFNAISDSAAILDDGLGTNVLQKLASIFPSKVPAPKISSPPATTQQQNNFSLLSAVSLADTIVRLDWEEGPYENRNYIIERRNREKNKESEFSEVGQVGSDATFYIDRGVKAKKAYGWRICQNNGGEKVCTGEQAVRSIKKKRILKPRLIGGIENGKIRLSWSPTYTTDFMVIIQRKGGKSKKYSTISVVSSDTQNSYLDENIIPGTKYTYQISVRASKKKTQKSKKFKIVAP